MLVQVGKCSLFGLHFLFGSTMSLCLSVWLNFPNLYLTSCEMRDDRLIQPLLDAAGGRLLLHDATAILPKRAIGKARRS